MSFDTKARKERFDELCNLNLAGEIVCPFCGEDEFDWIGLKVHLQQWCVPYDETPNND